MWASGLLGVGVRFCRIPVALDVWEVSGLPMNGVELCVEAYQMACL